MQKKRKVQEAFVDPKPRLSAFAAAKARAIQVQPGNTTCSEESTAAAGTPDVQRDSQGNPAALPTLLSSFPLSSLHDNDTSNDDIEDDDDDDDGAGYSSDDQIWIEQPVSNSYRPAQQPRDLCSFRPSKKTVLKDTPNQLVLKLKADETVTLIGEYDLEVLTGIIIVYGAAIRAGDGPNRVFAPSTHALPPITAKGGAAEISLTSVKLSMGCLSQLSPLYNRIWTGQNPKEGDANGQSSAGRSFTLLRNSADDALKRTLTSLTHDTSTPYTLSRLINPIPHTISLPQNPPVILVSGPKSSGKSTASRHLANTFLTSLPISVSKSVFWLDLDPGQPEFGPPGQVSLLHLRRPTLGPPFTHSLPTSSHKSHQLIRSHTLASVSPKEDSDHLVTCALDLISHYRRLRLSFPQAPCIINCSGWVMGSAVQVLLSLVKGCRVSDAVLMAPMDSDVVGEIELLLPKGSVVVIPPREGPKAAGSRSSAEFRAMGALAYFHSSAAPELLLSKDDSEQGEEVRKEGTRDLQTWDTRPLTHFRPWCVAFSGPDQGFLGISSYGEAVDPDFLATVINGMLLAVCVIEDDACFLSSYPPIVQDDGDEEDTESVLSRAVARSPEGLPYLLPSHSGIVTPLDPTYSRCLGLALVRGVDTVKQELQLLTPIPEEDLLEAVGGEHGGRRIVLVRGKFDSPDWAFLEHVSYRDGGADEAGKTHSERPYVAERKLGGESGLGGNVWRVRHLPRKANGDGGGGGGG